MGAGENTSVATNGFFVSRMNPSEILNLAEEFVVQYYTVMRKCPSGLHRFYKDDSAMIREDSNILGQKPIHDKIMALNVQDSRVGILSLDALKTNGHSVLIQVAGEMSLNGSAFRRFMQSFVLCEQAPCDFYVLNDIFRYQDRVYGDVKFADHVESVQREHIVPGTPAEFSRETPVLHSPPNGDAEVTVTTWNDGMSSELHFSKPSNPIIETHAMHHSEDTHAVDLEPLVVDECPTQPTHEPASPQSSPAAPEENLELPAASTQPCSWAQMASKQPKHGAVGIPAVKPNRVTPAVPPVGNFEEQTKGSRQPSVGAYNPSNQRFRGNGGRPQQTMDTRPAAGDNYYAQDFRPTGTGPMRTNFSRGGGPGGMGMRGSSRGTRGGGGGMGGRGGPFPRRGGQ